VESAPRNGGGTGATAEYDKHVQCLGFQPRQFFATELRMRRGQVVLTQLWITLHTDALSRFPHDGALMNAPIAQDDRPEHIEVPGWR
jgi:hypothetical protein